MHQLHQGLMSERAALTALGRLLEDEGRKQSWLAERLGVSTNTVSLWVNGVWTPTPENQDLIVAALRPGATPDQRRLLNEELWPAKAA